MFFSDFLDSFDSHPVTGQLARVTNESAVKQSLKNLVFTNYGDRLYQPTIGGNIRASLFEPIDQFTTDFLETSIKQTIFNHEPRVSSLDVRVKADPDNNAYGVTIYFTLINSQTLVSTDLVLTRVR